MGKAQDIRNTLDEGVLKVRRRQPFAETVKRGLGLLYMGLILTPLLLVPVAVVLMIADAVSSVAIVAAVLGCWLAAVAFLGGQQMSERDALAEAVDRALDRK